MSSAVFANGHWRRRDPLAGLNAAMRCALLATERGPLVLIGGRYVAEPKATGPATAALATASVAPATVAALAERGLFKISAGRDGTLRRYVRTARGDEILAELRRRAAVRARLALNARR